MDSVQFDAAGGIRFVEGGVYALMMVFAERTVSPGAAFQLFKGSQLLAATSRDIDNRSASIALQYTLQTTNDLG